MTKQIKRYSVFKKLPDGRVTIFEQQYAQYITKARAQKIADCQNDSEKEIEKILGRQISDDMAIVYKKTYYFIKEV